MKWGVGLKDVNGNVAGVGVISRLNLLYEIDK